MRLLKLLLMLLSCSIAMPAVAGPLEDAEAAYDKGDYTTALRLLRPFAEHGAAGAQYALANMYDAGQGMLQDYATAVRWYLKAAEQGHASAQLKLGVIYAEGRGVSQDYVQAYKWLNLAAPRFDAIDTESRAAAVKSRDALAAKMTPAQLAEAQRLASEWKPKPER